MRIEVKVIPKSSKEEIVNTGEQIRVYVKAAPDKGKANKAVIALIAKEYNVRKCDVSILRGDTNRIKVIEIQKD